METANEFMNKRVELLELSWSAYTQAIEKCFASHGDRLQRIEAQLVLLEHRVEAVEKYIEADCQIDDKRRLAYKKCLKDILISTIGISKLKADAHEALVEAVAELLKGELK